MTVYYANFRANNGTCLRNPIEDTSLKRIIKAIRNIAEGERFAGNNCHWYVWVNNGGEKCVAAGGYNSFGGRYRVNKRDLLYL